MVIVPVTSALITTWRGVAVYNVLGAVARTGLAAFDDLLNSHDRRLLVGWSIGSLATSLFSMYQAWRRVRSEALFSAMASVAEAAQSALLQPPGSPVGPLSLAVKYASAEVAAQIGGDFYALIETPHGVRVVVGDVRGKGLVAVRHPAVVLSAFREAGYNEPTLALVAMRRDASLRRNASDSEFATVAVLQFEPIGGTAAVSWISGGHPPPPLIDRAGGLTTLADDDPWPPLGLEPLASTPPEVRIEPVLHVGEVLLLYTDGVIEAERPRRVLPAGRPRRAVGPALRRRSRRRRRYALSGLVGLDRGAAHRRRGADARGHHAAGAAGTAAGAEGADGSAGTTGDQTAGACAEQFFPDLVARLVVRSAGVRGVKRVGPVVSAQPDVGDIG